MSRGSQVLVDCGPGQEDQLCVVSSVVYSPCAPRKGVAGDHLWLILLDAKSGKFLPHPVRCSHVKPPARDQFLRKLPPAFADADQRLFGDISATDAIPIMPPEFPGSVVGKTMLSTCTAKDSGQKGPENVLTEPRVRKSPDRFSFDDHRTFRQSNKPKGNKPKGSNKSNGSGGRRAARPKRGHLRDAPLPLPPAVAAVVVPAPAVVEPPAAAAAVVHWAPAAAPTTARQPLRAPTHHQVLCQIQALKVR